MTLVTNGLLGSLLVTGGLGIGITPPVTSTLYFYIDPQAVTLVDSGQGIDPQGVTLVSFASGQTPFGPIDPASAYEATNPFDPESTTINR